MTFRRDTGDFLTPLQLSKQGARAGAMTGSNTLLNKGRIVSYGSCVVDVG